MTSIVFKILCQGIRLKIAQGALLQDILDSYIKLSEAEKNAIINELNNND